MFRDHPDRQVQSHFTGYSEGSDNVQSAHVQYPTNLFKVAT